MEHQSRQKLKIVYGAHQEFANPVGEDRFCIRVEDNIALFAVFDGHGGIMACDFGCSVLLDSILTNLLAAQRRAQFDAAAAVSANEIAQRAVLEPIIVNRIIVDAFVACDNEILRRELEKMQESKRRLLPHVPSMPGSCAIVTVVMDGFIYVANLGDCRGTLCVGPPTGTKDGVSLSPPPFIPICESAKAPASSTFTSGGDREGFSPPDGLYTSDSESTCYYPSSSQSIYSSISSFTAASTSTVDARSDISAHADVIEFSFQFNLMDNGEDCTAGDFSSNAESIHVGRGAGLENSLSLKIQCTESRTEVKRELAVPPIAQGGYKKRKFGSVAGSDGGTRCSGNSGDQLIIAVGSITADQCCLNASECDRIRRTTDDPCPIRPGTRDILNRTKNPPLRLAGSLMTTRALGDCYLKHKELTQQDQPLGQFVPYRGFICRPAVYFRRLLPTDRVLILSSDGLWNFLTNDDVLRVLTEMGPEPAADNSDTRILTETAISSSDSSVCAAGSSGATNCSDYNNPSSCDPSISNRRLVRCSGKSCDTNSDATLIMSEMEVRRERCKPSAASDSAQGSSVSSARRSSRRSVTGLPTESGTLAQRLVEMAYGRANLAYAKTQPASSVAPDLRTLIGKNKRNYMDDVTVVTIRFE